LTDFYVAVSPSRHLAVFISMDTASAMKYILNF